MKKYLVSALMIAYVVGVGVVSHHKAVSGSSDFDTYWIAAGDVLEGRDIYRRDTGEGPYLYLPVFACFFTLFRALPFTFAHSAWFCFNVACFLAAARFLGWPPAAGPGGFWPAALRIAAAAFALAALADNLVMDQANVLMLAGLAGGFFLSGKGKNFWAGVLLAFAASVKVAPFLFLLYFLVKREWKVIAGWCAGIGLFVFLVPSLFFGAARTLGLLAEWKDLMLNAGASIETRPQEEFIFYKRLAESSGLTGRDAEGERAVLYHRKLMNLLNQNNQSLDGVFHRLFLRDLRQKAFDEFLPLYPARRYRIIPTLQLDERGVRLLVAGAAALMVFLTLAHAARGGPDEPQRCQFALWSLLSVMLAPVARTHMLILAVIPLFLAGRVFESGPAAGRRNFEAGLVVAVAVYFLAAIPPFKAYGAGLFAMGLMWAVYAAVSKGCMKSAP